MPLSIENSGFSTRSVVLRILLSDEKKKESYAVLSEYLEMQSATAMLDKADGRLTLSFLGFGKDYVLEIFLDSFHQTGLTYLFKDPYKEGYSLLQKLLSEFTEDENLFLLAKGRLLQKKKSPFVGLPYEEADLEESKIKSLTLNDIRNAFEDFKKARIEEIHIGEPRKKDSFSYTDRFVLSFADLPGAQDVRFIFEFPDIKDSRERKETEGALLSYAHRFLAEVQKRYAVSGKTKITFVSQDKAMVSVVFDRLNDSLKEGIESLLSLDPQEEDVCFARRSLTEKEIEKGIDLSCFYSDYRIDLDLGLEGIECEPIFVQEEDIQKRLSALSRKSVELVKGGEDHD